MKPRSLRLPSSLAVRCALWLAVFVAFPLSVTAATLSLHLHVLGCTTFSALPPGASTRVSLADRVVVYLVKAEAKESDAWYRDDYRIARVTLGFARRGSPIPHIEATYRVLGLHPDRVWPRIEAHRRAALGPLYAEFWSAGSLPRKPVQSVQLEAAVLERSGGIGARTKSSALKHERRES